MCVTQIRQRRPRVKLEHDAYRLLCRKVLERDGWRCQQCGRATELQVHHVKFRSGLGDDKLENLITWCSQCHREAHGQSGQLGDRRPFL
jgi:5-methylcytosine-specific restriction endonuclease McrA